MLPIQAWQVYLVHNCRITDPPKDKFVIITCFDPNPCGFFINTDIAPFIRTSPDLFACQILIPLDEHLFLQYDSWVDCHSVKSFQETELTDLRGNISSRTKQAILNTVQNCLVLRRRFKDMIK